MIKTLLGLFLVAVITSFSQNVLAVTYDQEFYSSNNIMFYNPDSTICDASVTVASKDNIETVLSVLTKAGLSFEQAAAVAGNFIVDSGSSEINPKATSSASDFSGGFGISSWSGERWNGDDGLKTFAEANGKKWDDLAVQLEYVLWDVGAGGSWGGRVGGNERAAWLALLSTESLDEAVETWMVKYSRPSSADISGRNKKDRLNAASNVVSAYKDKVSEDASSGGPAGCSGSAVAGDIANTAKNLSWPHRVKIPESSKTGYGREAAKPEFVAAAEKLTTDYSTAYFTDCGVFVATVMHASGVDESYPKRGTSLQMNYIQSSPKYEKFIASSEDQLRPGDILIRTGHTYIYTGKVSGTEGGESYGSRGASLYTRPPSGHYTYLGGAGSGDISTNEPFTVARYIGG